MKKNSIALLLILFFFASCSQTTFQKLQIELPIQPAIDISQYDRITMTDFLITKNPKNLDMSNKIVEYFQSEMRIRFPVEITHIAVSSLEEETFESPDFWKDLIQDKEGALILTGRAAYQADTRIAFVSTDKKQLETPFPSESRTYQKGFFTLDMDVYLIEAQSGEILFQNRFKETRSSKNIKQKASFTLYELLNSIKIKLFRQLAGGRQYQERYLLTR